MAIHYSIIIPTLNEKKFLPKLLTSLTTQTRRDFEVIVVDGASEDKTVSIAKSFAKRLPKLTVIVSDVRGVSYQRNIGAKESRGEWLIFIDADSILLSYALDRVDWYIKDKKPKLLTSWFRPDTEMPSDALVTLLFDMIFEAALIFHRPAVQGTFMVVATKVFTSAHGFDERRLFGEDYDLIKRITEKGNKLHILRETLYIYSLRRLRYHKKLKTLQSYARTIFSVLFTNGTPRSMPEYIMGGRYYGNTKKKRTLNLASIEKKLNAFIQEVFA